MWASISVHHPAEWSLISWIQSMDVSNRRSLLPSSCSAVIKWTNSWRVSIIKCLFELGRRNLLMTIHIIFFNRKTSQRIPNGPCIKWIWFIWIGFLGGLLQFPVNFIWLFPSGVIISCSNSFFHSTVFKLNQVSFLFDCWSYWTSKVKAR